jgi:hypothetical protein
MGINRWTEQQQRADKRGRDPDNLPDVPEEREAGGQSRLEASEGPAEDPEKQAVIEKLRERHEGEGS